MSGTRGYHVAQSGKKKGQAVLCPALVQCTIMSDAEHLTTDEAAQFNQEFQKRETRQNEIQYGITATLGKNIKPQSDFRQTVDLFANLSDDPAMKRKQQRMARKIDQSDFAIDNEADKISWKNESTETDLSGYDTDMQKTALDRFHQAVESEAEITSSLLASIAGVPGIRLDALGHRLKSPVSLARKIDKQSREKLLGVTDAETVSKVRKSVANKLQDVVRYTFVVENHEKLGDVVVFNAQKMLKEGYIPERSEHSYVEGNTYMDAKVIWVHPQTNESFEVQYHSTASMEAKRASHEIYEKLRTTTDAQEKLRLTAESSDVWTNMQIPSTLSDISERTGIDFVAKVRK